MDSFNFKWYDFSCSLVSLPESHEDNYRIELSGLLELLPDPDLHVNDNKIPLYVKEAMYLLCRKITAQRIAKTEPIMCCGRCFKWP